MQNKKIKHFRFLRIEKVTITIGIYDVTRRVQRIFVTIPAAIVTPETRNIMRPNSLKSE